MANTRISDLTASASNLASTDLAPVVQTAGVGPVKMTGAQIAAGLLSATTPIGSGPILARDASNTLALKNAGNAQIFRAYSTTTGPSYGYFASGVTDAGVATADTLFIGTGGAGAAMTKLQMLINGTNGWDYNASVPGSFTFYGAGGAAAKGIYLDNAFVGMARDATSSIRFVSFLNWNFTSSNSTPLLTFGGTTSSFPALKRSTTTLQVRLADDSGDAAFQCGTQTAGGTAFNVNGTGGNSIASVTNTTTGTLLQVLNSTSNPLMTVTDTTSGTLFSVQSTTAATLFSVNDTTSGTLLAVTNSSSTDVFTVSDAGQVVINGNANLFGEAANTLALRNGTSAQEFRVYNTYTDAATNEYARILWSGNSLIFGSGKTGTGVLRTVYIQGGSGGSGLYLNGTNAADHWNINTSGMLLAATDNTYDIGAATTTRPRNLFIAGYEQLTEMTAPAAPAANSVRIYAEDNGSGKTRLMALFATGAAQQIAIEP